MQYLVLENNNFTALTINSLKKCVPDAEYKIVQQEGDALVQALDICDDLTFVITGGIVLELKDGDIAPKEKLKKYHMCASKLAVFAEHPRQKHHYELIGSSLHSGVIDMSLFILNPKMWRNEKDSRLSDKKLLQMPRYMNHRSDATLACCMGGYEIIKYASLGEDASVFNYINHLESGHAEVRDTMGYCFDKLLPYTEGLSNHSKKVVETLAKKTSERASKLRLCLHGIKQKAVE